LLAHFSTNQIREKNCKKNQINEEKIKLNVQEKHSKGYKKIKRDKNKKFVLYLELFFGIATCQFGNFLILFFQQGFHRISLMKPFRISLSISGKAVFSTVR